MGEAIEHLNKLSRIQLGESLRKRAVLIPRDFVALGN